MTSVRPFVVIALLVIGVALALFFLKRDQKFLSFAPRAFKFSAVMFLALSGLYVLEPFILFN